MQEAIFEPMSLGDDFLSFSSFATLDISKPQSPSTYSTTSSFGLVDETLFPTLDPFEIVNTAFTHDLTLDSGAYHQAGPIKQYSNYPSFSSTSSSPPRPTTSEYDSSPLVTPSISNRVSFSTSPDHSKSIGFSWDDAILSTSSYVPPHVVTAPSQYPPSQPAQTAPLRIASNPVLGSTTSRPRHLKPVASMPALKEEDAIFEWLNLPDGPDVAALAGATENHDWFAGMEDSSLDGTIFAAFKEGESESWADLANLANLPSDTPSSTAPSAPGSTLLPVSSSDTQLYLPQAEPLAQVPADFTTDFGQQNMDFFTFWPAEEQRPSTAPEGGESFGMLSAPGTMTRSLTAPGHPHRAAPPNDIFYQAPSEPLSKPVIQNTGRSFSGRRAAQPPLTVNVTSPAFSHSTFTPTTYPITTPHSATYPSSSSGLLAAAPMQRAGTQPLPARASGQQMAQTVSADNVADVSAASTAAASSAPPLPDFMRRAKAIVEQQERNQEKERQELRRQAAARKRSFHESSVGQPVAPSIVGWSGEPQYQARPEPVVIHHYSPQPMTSMQPAPLQYQQQQAVYAQPPPHQYSEFAFHPPPQAGPSTYQPHSRASSYPPPPPVQHPPQPGIPVAAPILTTQPLVIHPPPPHSAGGSAPPTTYAYPPPPPHRIHPPPAQMTTPILSSAPNPSSASQTTVAGRPMARLPSPRSRKPSSPPKQRSPSGKRRREQSGGGGFSWGEATFINFTSDDAEKLLTGVAPSGSQNKRKREEEAARQAATMGQQGQVVGAGMQVQMQQPQMMAPGQGQEGQYMMGMEGQQVMKRQRSE